jgi:hypothetical protein
LEQFLQHPIDSKEDLNEAYLVGNRLCRFLSDVLPTHPDYWSADKNLVTSRTKSHSQLAELMYFCKQLAVMIDEDEHQSYISRVLDSSTDAPPRQATVDGDALEGSQSPDVRPGVAGNVHGSGVGEQEVEEQHVNISLEQEWSKGEAIGDARNVRATSFDDIWAKTATTPVRVRSRPIKDPNYEGSCAEPSQDESHDWHSFTEDMSWTKMSLSVSSSKFQANTSVERSNINPPQVVQPKPRKKKVKKQQLSPIEDVDEIHSYKDDQASWEKRIRRAQRNMESIEYNVSRETKEDDFSGEFPEPEGSPRREPLSGSPTNVLGEWAGWQSSYESSQLDISADDTKVSLITDVEKSTDSNPKDQRLSRRQRAMSGLKCVKCLLVEY